MKFMRDDIVRVYVCVNGGNKVWKEDDYCMRFYCGCQREMAR